MRGKLSEAEKALIRKLHNQCNYEVAQLAEEFERSETIIKIVLGMEVQETKTRTSFGHGYDQIPVELDRGQIKFYLPKDLTIEDVHKVVDAMYDYYQMNGEDEIIEIQSKPLDKFALMRKIIEEEALDDEEVPA